MVEETGVGRNWIAGTLKRPLGRGVNSQIAAPAVAPLVERNIAASWPLFMVPEDKCYRTGRTKVGVSQFMVQDPDGYRIRFSSRLGHVSPVRAEQPCLDPAGER